eukprot:8732181-Ditylum_brightwellii.AAC.1
MNFKLMPYIKQGIQEDKKEEKDFSNILRHHDKVVEKKMKLSEVDKICQQPHCMLQTNSALIKILCHLSTLRVERKSSG